MKKYLPLYTVLFIIHFFALQAFIPVASANPYAYENGYESYEKKNKHGKKDKHGKRQNKKNMLYNNLSDKDQKTFNKIMSDFEKDIRPLRKELKRKKKKLRKLYGNDGVKDMEAFNQVQQEMIELSKTLMMKRRETNKLVEEKIGIKLYNYKNMRKNHGLSHKSYRPNCYSGKELNSN